MIQIAKFGDSIMAIKLHTVVLGEDVFTICTMYQISFPRFVALNPEFGPMGVRNPDVLIPGEQIITGYTDPLKGFH
ncbi:hypothetical protein [Caudoviricetes sp.]|nr:hypothetical protein [Caudoviricetes sp.]